MKGKSANDQVELLKRLYDERVTIKEMMAITGLKKTAITSALHRHYPERCARRAENPFKTAEEFAAFKQAFAAGLSYVALAEKFNTTDGVINSRLNCLRTQQPSVYAALMAERTPKVQARKAAQSRRNVSHTWGRTTIVPSAPYSRLDDAIRTLQRFAPCYRDPNGGGIVYGRRLKTPDEILAMAERRFA